MPIGIARTSAIALALLVAGCAPLPMADAVPNAEAKKFETGPGLANVYVYRNQILGAAIRMAITVDGRELGVTHNFLSFTYHSRLKLVDETTGQEGVKECDLVAAGP